MSTEHRKLDHLRIAVDSDVEHPGTTWLEYVVLGHNAVPELDADEVDLSTMFLGKRLSAPLMVTGMTGGHPATRDVNCAIASAVEQLGLAMGVGSQRAAIENPSPEIIESFRAARKCAPTAPIAANIGMAQIVEGYSLETLERIVEMVEADALAIHLNVGQEVVQPEGDRRFRGFLDRLAEVVDRLSVPVIVKETGSGIGFEAAAALASVGVRYFDVAGAGGTSWILVEAYRARARGLAVAARAAEALAGWGIPTAQAVIETRWAVPDACVIASGGIRSPLDAVKSIVIGADLAGMALPVLRAYAQAGERGVRELLEAFVAGMRAAAVMLGARSVSELRARVPVILEPLARVLEQRGIQLKLYMRARLAATHRC